MDILFGGPLTGAAMNPARTFGPALAGWIAGASTYNPWASHLVYWIGPLIGAIAARSLYHKFLRAR
jgi:glycerol uptake facilitator-like aquaporin